MKAGNLARTALRGLERFVAVLKHAAAHSGPTDGPEVLIDIRERVNARTWMQVVLLFELSGYRPRIRVGSLNQLRSVASLLHFTRNFKLAWSSGKAASGEFLRADDSTSDAEKEHGKRIRLRYDYSPAVEVEPSHFMMPFILHPKQYTHHRALDRLEEYRRAQRRVRVIFSGNYEPDKYDNPVLRERFGKLPRYPIIDFLQSHGLGRVVTSWGELQSIYAGEYYNGLVLVDTSRFRILEEEWMNILSKTDFCLCPPGFIMPMCHNAVEAMAVGTIPVTNYPDWFFPQLTDRGNCIQFSSTEELREGIDEIRAMTGDQIAPMRERVVDYYDRHLSLPRFGLRLLSSPEREVILHVLDGTEASLRKSMQAGRHRGRGSG
jgi:glycosyltransferase involved in cell wall biosynthesis